MEHLNFYVQKLDEIMKQITNHLREPSYLPFMVPKENKVNNKRKTRAPQITTL